MNRTQGPRPVTGTGRSRTVRRPSAVASVLGVAALVVIPSSTGAPPGPAPSPAADPPAAVTAAGGSGPTSSARSIRFNPVVFRDSLAPAAPTVVPAGPRVTTTARPGTAAAVAIEFALAQRGLPYVWGGDGPQRGDAGFDCSGLTTAAYDHAGIDLPRTAHTQYYAGPHVPAEAEPAPGDLVFYGVPARVHHVGLYLGNGQMVAAPTFGKPVRISYVRYDGDDYLGATRPAAGRDADAGLLSTPELPVEVPPVPSPDVPPAPEEFQAPEVPADRILPPPVAEGPQALAREAPGDQGGGADERVVPSEGPDDDPAAEPGVPAPPPPTSPPPATPAPTSPEVTPSPSARPSSPTPTSPARTSPAPASPPPSSPPPSSPSPTARAADAATAAPPPVALALPGGPELTLTRADQEVDGLPPAPFAPGVGALRWSPADGSGAARATVALHPDAVVPQKGERLVLRAEDGTATGLTVRSRETLDADTAAERAAGRGESTRLVLLSIDPTTGAVLVSIAE